MGSKEDRVDLKVIDGGREGPSMGCEVSDTFYSPELSVDFTELPEIDPAKGFRLISIGTVPAPTCESCEESMVYTGEGTDWRCAMPFCDQEGIVVTTGVGGLLESAHRAT